MDVTPGTGADLMVATAIANGIDHCFANPGTTELHLVQALDRSAAMHNVLCAFEGVCSGAADAFARITGRPALGLYHLGPGFANALANIHNARRHHTPMINVIGDQASWHLAADAPLTSDIAALSRWSGALIEVGSPDTAAAAMAEAIRGARGDGPRISNLVVPADHAWGPTGGEPIVVEPIASRSPDPDDVTRAAAALSRPGAVLVLDGAALSARSLRLADSIHRATGCTITSGRPARQELGRDVPPVGQLPYFPQPLQQALAGVRTAVLTGADEPVTFFGYPDTPSYPLPSDAQRIALGGPGDDLDVLLDAVAAELGLEPTAGSGGDPEPLPAVDPGPLGVRNLGQAFAAAIPEGAIVVSEAISSGGGYRALASSALPHTLLAVTGGAIGGGLPTAVGAAVAAPDRPVLALQADGSALYTIQSLWTMAREQLDVTVVICANRRYQILDVELAAAGIELGAKGAGLTSLGSPSVDFAAVAAGFGVPGVTVTTGAELEHALDRAAAEPGPHLIEAVLDAG
jgi:acetolactate synthase-1/2/3 large subunit